MRNFSWFWPSSLGMKWESDSGLKYQPSSDWTLGIREMTPFPGWNGQKETQKCSDKVNQDKKQTRNMARETHSKYLKHGWQCSARAMNACWKHLCRCLAVLHSVGSLQDVVREETEHYLASGPTSWCVPSFLSFLPGLSITYLLYHLPPDFVPFSISSNCFSFP